MAELASQNIEKLFLAWRGGDAEAGGEMANRISDWFYALSSARMGEIEGRPPLERACQLFSQGVASVDKVYDLTPWAHGVIDQELARAGDRSATGDYASKFTGGRNPSTLLKSATVEMDGNELGLLAAAYDLSIETNDLINMCESKGGFPLALLEARYQLKGWMSAKEHVPFVVLPSAPNLDLAPLVLYETGRMQPTEAALFEQWILSDRQLCQDIAEFSSISLSMRSGSLRGLEAKAEAVSEQPKPVEEVPFGEPPPLDEPANVSLANPIPTGPDLSWLGVAVALVLLLATLVWAI